MKKGKLKAKSKWFEIRLGDGRSDVYLFGEIGWEVTAQSFLEALNATFGPITLHINSIGGSINDGFAIYNQLLKRDVDVVIEGFAASMASVIAMAGRTVRMHEVGLFMIHNPATAAFGGADDFRKVADSLDQIRDLAVKAYQQHSSADTTQLTAWMDEETWFTAEQALEAGFIDEVIAPDDMIDIAASAKKFNAERLPNLPVLMGAGQPAKQPAAPAATNGGGQMTPEEKAAAEVAQKKAIDDAVAAATLKAQTDERNRHAGITKAFMKYTEPDFVTLRDACIADPTMSVEAASMKLLDKLGEKFEPANPRGTSTDVSEKRLAAAEQWLLHRAGHVENGKRIALDGTNPFRGMRLIDIARESVVFGGKSVSGKTPMEIAQLALSISHSGADFPNALQNALHKLLLGAFNTAGDTWRAFCAVGDLADFRPHYRHLAGSFSDLASLNEDGEFTQGTMDDTRKETITAGTKGRLMNLSHQMIVNDDMGVFTNVARAMGRAGARAIENDVYALLALGTDMGPTMSDSATLFHANHANVTTGAPSMASFDTAIQVLRSQKLPNASTGVNEYLDLAMPPIFVGPLALGGDARTVNEAQYDPDTANKLQRPNKSRGLISKVVTSPRRPATVWHLFADPSEVPVIEVGFVQGQQEPQIVMQEAFKQYGIQWRVVLDYGVAAVNWIGCVRSTGV